MKRMMLVISILVFLSLACATLTGGGNDTNTSGTEANNQPASDTTGDTNDEDQGQPDAAVIPDTPCYNPFYPLAAGGAYTYQVSYSHMMDADPENLETAKFQIVTVAETDETLTVQTIFDEFSSEVQWVCSAEGLFSTEYAQFDFEQLGAIDIETISYEGVTLPVEAMWYIGSSWDMDYEVNMSYKVEELAVTSHVIGDLVNEITGIESVTVPAGTYPEAFRVETTGTFTIETDVVGAEVAVDVPMEMVTWYVKGVGMVKQDSSDANGVNILELIAVE